MSKSFITNFLLFQVGWFACVLGGAYAQPLLGSLVVMAVIAYHLFQATEFKSELNLLLLALVIGIFFESLMTNMALAKYSNGQIHPAIAPYWMILMWPLFATTLNVSMRWLKGLSFLVVALIGGLFAPLAYFAGNNLGAVVYDDIVTSLSVIAFAWAVLFPVLVAASIKFNGCKKVSDNDVSTEATQHV